MYFSKQKAHYINLYLSNFDSMSNMVPWYLCHSDEYCQLQMNCAELRSSWRHQIETFSALLALFAWNSLIIGEFPAQRPVTRSFDISLLWAWINGWVNNSEAVDLRCHHANCDVTVMYSVQPWYLTVLDFEWVLCHLSSLWWTSNPLFLMCHTYYLSHYP